MPETRGEWLAFLAGLLLIGLLIAAIVFRPKPSDPSAAAPRSTVLRTNTTARTTTPPAPPPPTTTSAETTTVAETTTSSTTQATTPAEAIVLRVAARDDTWLSIRQGSATGKILFEGTLAKGDTRSYTATEFHVRFGAAANVKATLNGKRLALPGGTYSATIDRAGLGTRSA